MLKLSRLLKSERAHTPKAHARPHARQAASPRELLEQLESRQLFVADPISTAHPSFFAVYGTPTVDGVINQTEWASAPGVVRAQANQYGSQVTMRYMYNERGLFVSADVRDDRVWADGSGQGTGNKWEFAEDDGLGLYFDPSNSRKRFLGTRGRFLGYNLGQPLGKLSGPGRVTRYDYLQGDGLGWGTNVNGGNLLTGMRWQNRVWGTLNNNNDQDTGWSSEVFLPWASIGMTAMPANGQFITTNFQVFFDNTGGPRDFITADSSTDPDRRLGARINDDEIQGVHSSFNYTWSGFDGPINYAQLTFVNEFQADAPRGIANFTAESVSGFSTLLKFNAPRVSQTQNGAVHSYDIRVSESPINTEQDWDAAQVIENNFVPRLGTQRENLRIGGLSPDTTYFVGVRGVDPFGRAGPIVTATLTTLNEVADPTGGQRIMVSSDSGQLVTESGTPFIMNGSHAVINTRYMRNLYPGEIWIDGAMRNFVENPGVEGDAGGYFDALSSYGVNTLRIALEWLNLPSSGPGAAESPNGTYWIESSPGVFNPAMRSYLHNVIDLAHQYGMRLILHPFNTFNFRTQFENTPYATSNGGPLSTIDDFFQNSTVLTMAINRVNTVLDWVDQSGHPETVIGLEPINEWDAPAWTINASGNSDSARTVEMRTRSKFMVRLAQSVKAVHPTALLIHTGDEVVPRGPVARAVFQSEAFDILAPHLYTRTTGEPVNNPDTDKSIRPAIDYAGIGAYWMTYRRDNRPVHNGEWGLTSYNWSTNRTYYTGVSAVTDPSKPWTVAMDTDMFRTTGWASFASGMASPGMRLGGNEMRDLVPNVIRPETHGFLPLPLPESMRQIQSSFSDFVSDEMLPINWANFNATSLAGRMRFGNVARNALHAFGSSDGSQGIVYVLENQNVSTGTVSGATLTIDGLVEATGLIFQKSFSVEVWSAGVETHLIQRIDALTTTFDARLGHRLTVTLPDFNRDVMIKFKTQRV